MSISLSWFTLACIHSGYENNELLTVSLYCCFNSSYFELSIEFITVNIVTVRNEVCDNVKITIDY